MKKEIKVKFLGIKMEAAIRNILKKKYNLLDSDEPDYLFFSEKSKNYLRYKTCVRIFVTPENIVPDFNICDYGIAFNYLSFGDRYMRYPLYLFDGFNAYKGDDYGRDLDLALHKHLNFENVLSGKTEFCSFVYSNSEAEKCRENLMRTLSKYKRVNSGGRYLNNVGGPVEDKLSFQLKHKFVIAFENTSTPGYTTEKIVHAFAAKAIPIYWGNPLINREFNEAAFINCHDFGLKSYGNNDSLESIVKLIKEVDNSPRLFNKYISAPAFCNTDYVEKMKKDFEAFLYNIFDQSLVKSYRRNRKYWGARYERKQKIGNDFYWLCRKIIPIRDGIRKFLR